MKPIQETLGFLLAQVCRSHRNEVDLALSEVGLHVGQEMLLLHLWAEEGMTQSQLAERLMVEPPTVTKALHRLERGGVIERRQDAEDARVSRVYLTEHGRSLQQPVLDAWRTVEERTLRGLTIEEQIVLRRLLLQVRNNLA
jgi:MarR family transcriptional regulator, organic hydroperoxide resistance regulator